MDRGESLYGNLNFTFYLLKTICKIIDLVESVAEFTRAQSLNNSAQLILYGAAYFGSMGYPLAGVRFIDQFYRNTENQSSRAISANRLARWLGIKNATTNSELDVLRAKLINNLL